MTAPMIRDIALRDRVIVALDYRDPSQARALVNQCESHIGFYKVGLELFMADWFYTVDWLIERGHQVMLDLKYHDIPNTVAGAVTQAARHRIRFCTVHARDTLIGAAVQASSNTEILAVTVLTSVAATSDNVEEKVLARARRALAEGGAGIVCSGHEISRIRTELGDQPIIVTPGIRPFGCGGADDQRRVVTAGAAVAAGADHLVVGRPLTKAVDPLAVIEVMQEEIVKTVDG
jgi:orotidine-5'-phosphate decarboxylase